MTIDSEDLLLVNINDTIKNPNAIASEKADEVSTPAKRKGRKRRASSDDEDASEAKSPRHDDDDFNSTFQTATPGRSRRSMYSADDDSRASFGTEQSFALSELKNDDDDDEDEDLVEIIKEEPGNQSSEIVSIQSMGPPQPGPSGSGPPMPGQISMGDLNEVSVAAHLLVKATTLIN